MLVLLNCFWDFLSLPSHRSLFCSFLLWLPLEYRFTFCSATKVQWVTTIFYKWKEKTTIRINMLSQIVRNLKTGDLFMLRWRVCTENITLLMGLEDIKSLQIIACQQYLFSLSCWAMQAGVGRMCVSLRNKGGRGQRNREEYFSRGFAARTPRLDKTAMLHRLGMRLLKMLARTAILRNY